MHLPGADAAAAVSNPPVAGRPAARVPAAPPGGVVGRLFAPVDVAWLVCFRVLFGGMLAVEAIHYLANGWPRAHYDPHAFHFTFAGFHWVRPWPGAWGMTAHFAAIGILGLLVALGLFYRVAAALLFVAFAYVFLLDKTYYLNHFYLIVLLAFLMVFLPAHRAGSLDARRRPGIRSGVVPAWTLFLIRFQVGLVYVFGGVAKLNPDWLRGEPMRLWLRRRTEEWPAVAPALTHDATPYLFSYGGILLDLLIVPALLYRRTRLPAVLAAATFHLTNAAIFDIGIFPWLMLGATVIFFEPDWTRRLAKSLRIHDRGRVARSAGDAVGPRAASRGRRGGGAVVVVGFLVLWAAVQLLLPFRHWLYPGEVNWTEEGHRFSWHMKLRDKQGSAIFELTDPSTGEVRKIDPADTLTRRQARFAAVHPDCALQFARHVADQRVRDGRPAPVVRVRGAVSLNGRTPQPLIDPTVDLASVDAPPFARWTWVLPLTEPLRRAPDPGEPDHDGDDDAER